MSSGEEAHAYGEGEGPWIIPLPGSKRRRLQRACDTCRRKKIRCDSGQVPGDRCSNCIAFNSECTHNQPIKKRGPPNKYVEDLEQRVKNLEKMLQDQKSNHPSGTNSSLASPRDSSPTSTASPPSLHSVIGDSPPSAKDEADDEAANQLVETMKFFQIDSVETNRFFGQSSSFMFTQTAIDIKQEYEDNEGVPARPLFDSKRPEFWCTRPWEQTASECDQVSYAYPEEDLLPQLVNLYFSRINIYFPLLHRPTFEKSLAEGFHLTNSFFGATVLMVCALGSRFSDDPRTFLDDKEESSGWKYFKQVQTLRKSLLNTPNLYEIQFYCMATVYLLGTSTSQACWTMAGLGIRFAQEVGAHRRKAQSERPTVESEQWKRAFWILLSLDRSLGSFLGRPCAIQDEDFNLDLPIECDDEYWEHPDPALSFKQPPNKPSVVTYFNCHLKLWDILGITLRTLYSLNKPKIFLTLGGQDWRENLVTELDSMLNQWADMVPDHLRWDPKREHPIFFNQSALLYATYYHVQIQVHRPFIPSPRQSSPISFPSLAICANAARSCSHVMDIHNQRSPPLMLPLVQIAIFTSAVVLLVNLWGAKRTGMSSEPYKEIADVHKCMNVLKASEKRWHVAGRLWDILYELSYVRNHPLPKAIQSSNKRPREQAEGLRSLPISAVSTDGAYNKLQTMQSGAAEPPVQPASHTPYSILPVNNSELGRLPAQSHPDVTSPSQPSFNDGHDWYSHLFRDNPIFQDQFQTSTTDSNSQQFPLNELPYGQTDSVFTGSSTRGMAHPPKTSQNLGEFQQFIHPSGHQQSIPIYNDPNSFGMLDSDTISMWSNTPVGTNLEEWIQYISSMGGIALDQGFEGASR